MESFNSTISMDSDVSQLIADLLISPNASKLSSNSNEGSSDEREIIIRKLMKLYVRHNLTIVCLVDIVRLINISSNMQLPTSKDGIFSMFNKCSPYEIEKKIYVNCTKCKTYTNDLRDGRYCNDCNSRLDRTETNFSFIFPSKAR